MMEAEDLRIDVTEGIVERQAMESFTTGTWPWPLARTVYASPSSATHPDAGPAFMAGIDAVRLERLR